MKWRLQPAGIAIGLVAGLALGYSIASVRSESQTAALLESIYPIRLQNQKYSLINPLVAYETPETVTLKEYKSLKDDLQNVIDTQRESINRISVYYRNLNTGDWIGINQNDFYYPASLLKVPVMIAYFKEAETDASLLQKRIVYQRVTGGDPFEAASDLVPGTSYTTNQLIEKMIINSDNGATYTLLNHIDQKVLDEVYTDLGITKPGEDTSTYQISTRTYALFFRTLYNATYLTPEYSEKALTLLSKTTFMDGLAAGIPSETAITHKYGEHVVSADRKNIDGVELHDCGIVYHPKQQYLLCVMTAAKSLDDAKKIISSISAKVYAAAEKN